MKNPLIHLPVDKVTISEQGRDASRRMQEGDKPFVTFLSESEAKRPTEADAPPEVDYDTVEETPPIGDEDEMEWFSPPAKVTRTGLMDDRLALDVGSRLEFIAPLAQGNIVIRSTTKVNLSDGPYSCETNWEVFPEEEDLTQG